MQDASKVLKEADDSTMEHPPRRVTFLARYPRNMKLGLLGVSVLVLAGLWFVIGGAAGKHNFPKPTTIVHLADTTNKEPQETFSDASTDKNVSTRPITAKDQSAPSLNDQDDRTIKMTAAPDPNLSEDTAQGSLPRIGEDGRMPWQVYARPFNTADRRPRIAIIITDLGTSRVATDEAISRTPANVTLAFNVLSPAVGAWCNRARQDGHEVFIQLPMEPFDYPRSDPGPETLLTTLPTTDNIQRLLWGLRQGMGYVGITTLSGSRFTSEVGKFTPVLDVLKSRGLMILDARVAPHSAVMSLTHDMSIPAVAVTTRLDQNLAPEAIDAALNQLEQTARLTGRAVGMTPPLPIIMEKLQVWLKQLPQHGIALAPVSAMTM